MVRREGAQLFGRRRGRGADPAGLRRRIDRALARECGRPLVNYSAQDYLGQFQRLLPRGRVWHRGLDLVQDFYLLTLMPTWARLQVALNSLIAEIFPCSTRQLLPEWEATLGLPDPCIGTLGNLQMQQQLVCVKFVARGGQSKAYFIDLAAKLGYEISITEFAPFRAGINRAGDPVYGDGWA